MDREIPDKVRKNRRKRIILAAVIPFVVVIGAVWLVIALSGSSVRESDLRLSVADRGAIEASIEAQGHVVPAVEEIVVSPVSTRILEVYSQEGDRVEQGQPLLRLDLESAETEVRKMQDELSMRQCSSRETALNSRTYLTNLEMKIRAKEMAVADLRSQLRSERRLDSLGSGTGERVRQADLAYRTAALELEQMRREIVNERQAHAAVRRSKQLEEGIASQNLGVLQRTLDDARVKAPRAATLTYINSKVGASIAQGEKIAVLSDLSHFRIRAEVSEGEADKVVPGAKAIVKVGRRSYAGTVVTVVPQAVNGMISFTVRLDSDADAALRAGLRATVHVVYEIVDDLVRIANGPYYTGPGAYDLFVETSPGHLEKKHLELGVSNADYVEVRSGLSPGQRVVVGDMSTYKNRSSLKIKQK